MELYSQTKFHLEDIKTTHESYVEMKERLREENPSAASINVITDDFSTDAMARLNTIKNTFSLESLLESRKADKDREQHNATSVTNNIKRVVKQTDEEADNVKRTPRLSQKKSIKIEGEKKKVSKKSAEKANVDAIVNVKVRKEKKDKNKILKKDDPLGMKAEIMIKIIEAEEKKKKAKKEKKNKKTPVKTKNKTPVKMGKKTKTPKKAKN